MRYIDAAIILSWQKGKFDGEEREAFDTAIKALKILSVQNGELVDDSSITLCVDSVGQSTANHKSV